MELVEGPFQGDNLLTAVLFLFPLEWAMPPSFFVCSLFYLLETGPFE